MQEEALPARAGPEPSAGGEARDRPFGRPEHEVFVSYSSQDKPTADAIVARLEQSGVRCWIAPRDVIPGMVWGEAIVRAIDTSRLMIVVISGEANRSRQVVREVEHAVSHDVIVVPFRIEAIEPTGAMAYFLASEHWLDAMTPPLDAHISQLVHVTQTLLGIAVPRRAPAAPPGAPAGPGTAPGETAGAARRPGGRPSRRSLVIGLSVAALVAIGAVAGTQLLDSDEPKPSPSGTARSELAAGDCVQAPEQVGDIEDVDWWSIGQVPVVPCDEPHDGEVVSIEDLWDEGATYPGDDAVIDQWIDHCSQRFEDYVGTPWLDSALDFTGWYPFDATAWSEGDREAGCIAFDPGGQLEGSVAGAER